MEDISANQDYKWRRNLVRIIYTILCDECLDYSYKLEAFGMDWDCHGDWNFFENGVSLQLSTFANQTQSSFSNICESGHSDAHFDFIKEKLKSPDNYSESDRDEEFPLHEFSKRIEGK